MNEKLISQNNNSAFLQIIINKITDLNKLLTEQKICIKDANSLTLYSSPAFATFIGVPISQMLGKISWWLPLYDASIIEDTILAEDRLVISSRTSHTIFKINNINGALKPYLCIKSPIINPQNNEVAGIYINCIENGICSLLNVLTQNSKSSSKQNSLPYLNRREKQVVFLFLSHLNSTEIADILSKLDGKIIKKTTVDSVFNDQLYVKFNVNSRPAFYSKLISLGYNKMIPHEILSIKSFIIDQLIAY